MTTRRRALLTFWIGILLLFTAVAVPGQPPVRHEVTYETQRVDYQRAEPPWESERVELVDCRHRLYHAECLWIRSTGGNGTVRVEADGAQLRAHDAHLFDFTDYHVLRDRYVRGHASVEDGSLVVSFRPVPVEQVFLNASVPVESTSPLVQRAVADGTASTSERTWGGDWERPTDFEYVAGEDGVYRLRIRTLDHTALLSEWNYDLLRIVGFLAGLSLVWVGRGRHAQVVKSGRPDGDQ